RKREEAAGKEYQCRICVNADEVKGMLEMIKRELGKEREARERMEVEMKEALAGPRGYMGEDKGVVGAEISGQKKKTHVQCGECQESVDIEDTRFDSVEEAEKTEFMCRMCVLYTRQDRMEAESTRLMARIVELERELAKERNERHEVEDKLAQAEEKLAEAEDILLTLPVIQVNDKVVERDGGDRTRRRLCREDRRRERRRKSQGTRPLL
ncbi:unnamed protein product, partial [Ixodes hexagonus]